MMMLSRVLSYMETLGKKTDESKIIQQCVTTHVYCNDTIGAHRNHNRFKIKVCIGETAISLDREIYTFYEIQIQTHKLQINMKFSIVFFHNDLLIMHFSYLPFLCFSQRVRISRLITV